MDKFSRTRRIINVDSPVFKIADPNDPVKYRLNPKPRQEPEPVITENDLSDEIKSGGERGVMTNGQDSVKSQYGSFNEIKNSYTNPKINKEAAYDQFLEESKQIGEDPEKFARLREHYQRYGLNFEDPQIKQIASQRAMDSMKEYIQGSENQQEAFEDVMSDPEISNEEKQHLTNHFQNLQKR